jgi:hypothetical protein
MTRAIYGLRLDFRRYNPLLTRESVEQELGISLAGRPDPQKLSLDSRRPQQIALMEDIGRVYAQCLDWGQSHVMPWDTIGGQQKPDTVKRPIDWSRTPFG